MFGEWYSLGEFLDDLRKLAKTFECDEDTKNLELLIDKYDNQDS